MAELVVKLLGWSWTQGTSVKAMLHLHDSQICLEPGILSCIPTNYIQQLTGCSYMRCRHLVLLTSKRET